jgi:hypothetical protein
MIHRVCQQCGQKYSSKPGRNKFFCSITCSNKGKGIERQKIVTRDNVMQWVTVDPATGCWNWNAGKNQFGYGMKAQNGKKQVAHRLVYSLLRGEPPKHLYGCHTCDNPSCCNPDHIFFGTCQDNMNDAKEKERLPQGMERSNSKLTDNRVREIRRLYAGGARLEDLASRYGVGRLTVYKAAVGETWKHVDR